MTGSDDLEVDDVDLLEEDSPPDDDLDLIETGDADEDVDAPLEEEDEPEAQVRKPSRAEQRIQKQANENRELRERLARLEGEREGSSRTHAAPRDPRADYEQEQALLSTMTADEKVTYFQQKNERQFGQALASVQQQTADKLDRIDFRDLCRENKAYAKVAPKVEELKKKYPGVDRETLAKFASGDAFVSGGMKKAQAIAERSAANVRRQRGKPPAGTSDIGVPERRGAPKTAKERLEAAEAKGFKW
jgi:hypothetical protein